MLSRLEKFGFRSLTARSGRSSGRTGRASSGLLIARCLFTGSVFSIAMLVLAVSQLTGKEPPPPAFSAGISSALAEQRKWLTRWDSLSLRFETLTVECEGVNASDRNLGTRNHHYWKYDQSGLIRHEWTGIDGKGRCFTRNTFVLTPDRIINARFPTKPLGDVFPESVVITRRSGESNLNVFEAIPFKGLFLEGQWLPDAIPTAWSAEEQESLDFEGTRLPRLKIWRSRDTSLPREELTLTYDSRHACLPRLTASNWPEHVTVDEFREVRPGLWIPWRGSTQLGGAPREARWKSTWVVTACEVDLPLVAADFQVPIGADTKVTDAMTVIPEPETPIPKPPESLWEQWIASEGRPGGKPALAGLMVTVLLALIALLALLRLLNASRHFGNGTPSGETSG